MIVVDMQDECIEEVKNIHIEFPFPDLQNPLYISKKVAIGNGKVIGAGFVRLTGEGILILDRDQPTITRARAGAEIIEALKDTVKKNGLDECHVFVHDMNVRKYLQHLGFNNCKGGQAMVIHF